VDVKSLVAGVLLAFGVSNLLEAMGMGFAVPRSLVIVADVPIGAIAAGIVSIGIALYLMKSK
jgi:hypothetical protein